MSLIQDTLRVQDTLPVQKIINEGFANTWQVAKVGTLAGLSVALLNFSIASPAASAATLTYPAMGYLGGSILGFTNGMAIGLAKWKFGRSLDQVNTSIEQGKNVFKAWPLAILILGVGHHYTKQQAALEQKWVEFNNLNSDIKPWLKNEASHRQNRTCTALPAPCPTFVSDDQLRNQVVNYVRDVKLLSGRESAIPDFLHDFCMESDPTYRIKGSFLSY